MGMDLQSIERDALAELEASSSLPAVETVYTRYLGRKDGRLTSILKSLGSLGPEEKKRMGQEANRVRTLLEEKFAEKQKVLRNASLESQMSEQKIDLTLPGTPVSHGHAHPILETIREIGDIFSRIGFTMVEGPEIETDKNNFTDLNIPENHPARDMQDTFYIDRKGEDGKALLLRTHTSPVQVRIMKSMKPPVRIISAGRVFRHEATDATHAAIFHQLEGLAVDEGLSFADLKGTLTYFAESYFGPKTKVRFSPSYFPFVEPGAQMDASCFMCEGSGKLSTGTACGICKATGWIELLGAGMVNPQVLRNVGYDPQKVTGFAFGIGIERIVMTRLQVRDIRLFLDSDMRFLEQFR
jgi:phenylalanyl-tRNA synthetase alpha chain